MIKYTGNSIILKKLPFQLAFTAKLPILIFACLTVFSYMNCATPVTTGLLDNAPEAAPFITIVNNTGTAAFVVHISETTSDYWGEDWLKPTQIIRNTESITFQLQQPLNIINMYDLRLIDYVGNAYTKRNLVITGNNRIIFRTSDFSDGPPINITNNTGVTIWYAYISETTSLTWGKDILLADQMILNGESAMVRLPYNISEVNRYDFRLVEAHSRSEYIKINVPVTSYGSVIFTGNDLYLKPDPDSAVNQAEPAVLVEQTELTESPEPAESLDITESAETIESISEIIEQAEMPEESAEPAVFVEQTELTESLEPIEQIDIN